MRDNLPLAAALGSFSLGLIHSLMPSHWLPVVLLAKARKWATSQALGAAAIAASGHILISIVIGVGLIFAGSALFAAHLETAEEWASLFLIAFGLAYAARAYFQHARCHGHSHHGEAPPKGNAPLLFLFSLGLSPCATVLPTFVTAAASGTTVLAFAIVGFAAGVLTALVATTLLTLKGVANFDHPIFEHHGDVITGLAASSLGLIFWLFHEAAH